MWIYQKKLEVPVKVCGQNPKLASFIINQYGGPDGELSASLTYLNQRYTMPTNKAKALLTDIGTEELAHMEIIATLVYKLTENCTAEEFKNFDWGSHYASHGSCPFWEDASGNPWIAAYIGGTGDPIADIYNNMAAEQKARAIYENLLNLSDDFEVNNALKWLREREVVHFQRFGEILMDLEEYMGNKKYY